MTLLHSDARLARRAAAGDERAFAAIYRRYHQDLYRFCLSIVGRPEDAQDALQNTMVKALRSLPGEEREIQLKPWLYRVAHNESVDLLRRRREGPELEAVNAIAAVGLTEKVAQRERLGQLLADLEALPERQRSALVMRELAGLGYEQIAEAFDSSGQVARQTVYEARANLRQLEAGREMDCDLVTRQISEADGRLTRRRDIQAHLRACPDCRAFCEAIDSRRGDLAALAPLPAVAASSILKGLVGGGHAAGGIGAAGIGTGAGKAITTSAIVKSAATVAAVGAIGVSAADRTGLVHVGLPGSRDATPAKESRAAGESAVATGRLRAAHGVSSTEAAAQGGHEADSRAAAESVTAPASGAESPAGHGHHAATGGAAGHSTHASGPPADELPAASEHGQQTAASHGGGRAAAGTRSKGKSPTARGHHDHPGSQSHPSHQSHPTAPSHSKRRPESPPHTGEPPDNSPAQPLQPSQAPTETGPAEDASDHESKEAR